MEKSLQSNSPGNSNKPLDRKYENLMQGVLQSSAGLSSTSISGQNTSIQIENVSVTSKKLLGNTTGEDNLIQFEQKLQQQQHLQLMAQQSQPQLSHQQWLSQIRSLREQIRQLSLQQKSMAQSLPESSQMSGTTLQPQNATIQGETEVDQCFSSHNLRKKSKVAGGCTQEAYASAPWEGNLNALSSHSGFNMQSQIMLQHQQQEQMQQLHQQISAKLQAHQRKLRQLKPGEFQQHLSAVCIDDRHQQLNSGSPFPTLSRKVEDASSRTSSPRADQQNPFTDPKFETSFETASSPSELGKSNKPLDLGPLGIQPQFPRQSLPMLRSSNQSLVCQQLLSQNIVNSIPLAGVQCSNGLSWPSTSGQNASIQMQNVSATSPDLLGKTMGQENLSSLVQQQQQQQQFLAQQSMNQQQQQQQFLAQQSMTQQQRQQQLLAQHSQPQSSQQQLFLQIQSLHTQMQQLSLQSQRHPSQHQLLSQIRSLHKQMRQLSLQQQSMAMSQPESSQVSGSTLQPQNATIQGEEEVDQRIRKRSKVSGGCIQQALVSAPREGNFNGLSSQSSINPHTQIMPQHQQLEQMQQLHQQLSTKLQAHQRILRQLKPGEFQQVLSAVCIDHQHQLNSGSPLPTLSTKVEDASSRTSSPRADQKNPFTDPKAETPFEPAISHCVFPSPSTPMAASPIPEDSKKPCSAFLNAVYIGHQETTGVGAHAKLNSPETYVLDSTAKSCDKRPRMEASHALLEGIREQNRRLIDTVIDIRDEEIHRVAAAAVNQILMFFIYVLPFMTLGYIIALGFRGR